MTKRITCVLMMFILVSQGCFAQDVFFGKARTEEYIPVIMGTGDNGDVHFLSTFPKTKSQPKLTFLSQYYIIEHKVRPKTV